MIIRAMEFKDIDQVVSLGREMHEESAYSCLTFSPAKVENACARAILDGREFAFVAEEKNSIVAVLGAFMQPYEYGNEFIAFDSIVYVQPKHRGGRCFLALVKEYTKWAEESGAAVIALGQTTAVNIEKTTRLYEKLGFKYVGGTFFK